MTELKHEQQYNNCLHSIMDNAGAARELLFAGRFSDFATAVSDIEDDVKRLLLFLNDDDVMLGIWEREARMK